MAATCWSQKFRSDFSNCLLVFQKTEIRKARKKNMPVMENACTFYLAFAVYLASSPRKDGNSLSSFRKILVQEKSWIFTDRHFEEI